MLTHLAALLTDWRYELTTALLLAGGAMEMCFPVRRQGRQFAWRWATNATLWLTTVGALIALSSWNVRAGAGGHAGIDASLPLPVVALLSFLVLDLVAYGLHRVQHKVGVLWRLHAVHHADLEMDVSTAIRHHPGEAMVNVGIAALVLAPLPLPAGVVPIFAAIALAAQAFQHANVAFPPASERWLGWLLVTPGMHRVHHSVAREHHDRNFGLVLSIWDRVFGTLRILPAGQDAALRFGVPGVRPAQASRPLGALLLPFLSASQRDGDHIAPARRRPSSM